MHVFLDALGAAKNTLAFAFAMIALLGTFRVIAIEIATPIKRAVVQ